MMTHSIERGLVLKNSRPQFGKEKIGEILECLPEVSIDDYSYVCAISTLKDYHKYNADENLKCEIDKFPCKSFNNIVDLTKEDLFNISKSDFRSFTQKRYSIRNFTDEEVDIDILKDAIQIAQKAPSACNRQPARVYIIKDKKLILQILNLQGGAEGFKNLVNKLLILASDIKAITGGHERNQSFIDSSLFGMCLIHALHYFTLGSCTLAWWPSPSKDKKLRKLASIDKHHNVIFMIAVGHLCDKFKVPDSPKRPTDQIYYIR